MRVYPEGYNVISDLRGRVAPCQAFARAVPMDTVPCGHLDDCTPLVRVRYMSDNPFTQGA